MEETEIRKSGERLTIGGVLHTHGSTDVHTHMHAGGWLAWPGVVGRGAGLPETLLTSRCWLRYRAVCCVCRWCWGVRLRGACVSVSV